VLLRVRTAPVEMGHGVHQERRVVDHDDPQEPSPEETPDGAPEEGAREGRQSEPRDDPDPVVQTELPPDQAIGLQVRDVLVHALRRLAVEEPQDMRPESASADGVRVPAAVHVPVRGPMIRLPRPRRVLEGHRAEEEIERLAAGWHAYARWAKQR